MESRRRFLAKAGWTAVGVALGAREVGAAAPGPSASATPASATGHPDGAGLLRLHLNENPLGPSPAALLALGPDPEGVGCYPEADSASVAEVLARYHGLPGEMIVAACGSTEAIQVLLASTVPEGSHVVLAEPAFHLLPALVANAMARPKPVGLDEEGRLMTRRVLSAVDRQTSLVYVVNPHNPTGTVTPKSALVSLVRALPPRVVLAVDEAYGDYVDDPAGTSCVDLVGRYPNLVVVRTLSKAHGLAGLRVGYCIAPAALAGRLATRRLPCSVGTMAQRAVGPALSDRGHLARVVDLNRLARKRLVDGLRRLGVRATGSQANFVLASLEHDSEAVGAELARQGILVHRPWGLPRSLRITTGTIDQMDRLLAALERALTAKASSRRSGPVR